MNNDGYPLYLDRAHPARTVPPATLCLAGSLIAACAGLWLASTVPGWCASLCLAVAVAGLIGCTRIRGRWFSLTALGALMLAVFAWAQWTEHRRQAANFAVSERLFRDSLPPFDSVGAVPKPADEWLTDRDLPRMRIARIVGVVVEAPPPPAPRHLLQNQPRVYLIRTETIAGIGGPAEPLQALVRIAVSTDARLPGSHPGAATMAVAAPANPLAIDPAAPAEPLYPYPGQRIEAVLRLTEIRPGGVAPGQFDAELQWLLAGLHAHASIDPRQWRRLPDDAGFSPIATARRAQIYFAENINRHLHGREADTLRALCWGDSSDLTYEDRRSFQETGTVHLLAISGLHIYVVLYLLLVLTRPLLRARASRYLLLAVLLWTYAGLTGFHEPVLRAVLMFSLWIGARVFERRFDALNAWAVSGLAILVVSPQSAHTVGFQMSYLTVGMLIWWAPACGDWLYARLRKLLNRWLLPTVVENGCRSIAAGGVALVTTLPLVVYYFGVAPGWAVVANLVLIPLFELLLLVGLPATLWFCVSDPGWPAELLQAATARALDAADGLAAWFGTPADIPAPRLWAIVTAAGLLVLAGLYFRRATAPAPVASPAAVRRQFAYPSFALICGAFCATGLALSGAAPARMQPELQPEIRLLGRSHPCVVAVPATDTPVPGSGWDGYAPRPPDSPGSVEAVLRQPVAHWHVLLAPDVRDQPRVLAAGVVLACDGPALRQNLATLLTTRPAGSPPMVLLLYLTSDSAAAPALSPALAAVFQAHLRTVVLLDSPWRQLEPDAQAWLAWSRTAQCPVVSADAAPLWRIAPDGRTARLIDSTGERVWDLAAP